MAFDPDKYDVMMNQAAEDVLKELAPLRKQSILDAFDSEFGYNEKGKKVPWPQLNTRYVNDEPPRGRGGSDHPILFVDGDLRAGIDSIVNDLDIEDGVFSSKMKARGGKGAISVEEISETLSADRPHTDPSIDFKAGGKITKAIFKKHIKNAMLEMMRQGILF